MADDTNATTTIDPTVTPSGDGAPPAASSATPAPSSTPPPVRTFTQDEVNRIAADAREAGRRSATNAAPPPKAPEQRAAPSAPATESSRLDALEARYALSRAANLEGVRLSDEQEADLLTLYTVQRPEQPGEWFGRKVAAFNLKPAAPPAPIVNPGAPAAPIVPVPPAAASTTAPGAPTTPVPGVLVDASRLTPAQLAQMSPQALVQAVGQVVQAGQGSSGLPTPPHLRLRKP